MKSALLLSLLAAAASAAPVLNLNANTTCCACVKGTDMGSDLWTFNTEGADCNACCRQEPQGYSSGKPEGESTCGSGRYPVQTGSCAAVTTPSFALPTPTVDCTVAKDPAHCCNEQIDPDQCRASKGCRYSRYGCVPGTDAKSSDTEAPLDEPNCFAKPATACASLLWAAENNKTMCLVPTPPSFLTPEEQSKCAGLGLGCPGDWNEWAAHGYDPTGEKGKLGECYCDSQTGNCTGGTIAKYYAQCGCSDAETKQVNKVVQEAEGTTCCACVKGTDMGSDLWSFNTQGADCNSCCRAQSSPSSYSSGKPEGESTCSTGRYPVTHGSCSSMPSFLVPTPDIDCTVAKDPAHCCNQQIGSAACAEAKGCRYSRYGCVLA